MAQNKRKTNFLCPIVYIALGLREDFILCLLLILSVVVRLIVVVVAFFVVLEVALLNR